jgi:hypothetical protein
MAQVLTQNGHLWYSTVSRKSAEHRRSRRATLKQSVSPGILAAILVVVLAVIGFFAYRTFFVDPNYTPIKGEQAEKAYNQSRANDREMYQRMRSGAKANGTPP